MKKLIHRYLSETFFIEKGKIKAFLNPWSVSSDILIKDLNNIFDLNKKELKWWVKSWVRKQNRNFDFNDWWTPKINHLGNIFMPFVSRVAASTIGEDLIPVQPMEGPTGQLLYMEYQYTASIDPIETFTPRINVASRYGSATINENAYECITVRRYGNVEEDRTVTRMLTDWTNLINEQTQI
jgi:hypothetical protein